MIGTKIHRNEMKSVVITHKWNKHAEDTGIWGEKILWSEACNKPFFELKRPEVNPEVRGKEVMSVFRRH